MEPNCSTADGFLHLLSGMFRHSPARKMKGPPWLATLQMAANWVEYEINEMRDDLKKRLRLSLCHEKHSVSCLSPRLVKFHKFSSFSSSRKMWGHSTVVQLYLSCATCMKHIVHPSLCLSVCLLSVHLFILFLLSVSFSTWCFCRFHN